MFVDGWKSCIEMHFESFYFDFENLRDDYFNEEIVCIIRINREFRILYIKSGFKLSRVNFKTLFWLYIYEHNKNIKLTLRKCREKGWWIFSVEKRKTMLSKGTPTTTSVADGNCRKLVSWKHSLLGTESVESPSQLLGIEIEYMELESERGSQRRRIKVNLSTE